MLFLVVDDDELSRELLTLLLGAEGYAVDAAGSGEAALARVASQPASRPEALPDVILVDMQMPGLAGPALAAALRAALHGWPALLLAMSGSQPEVSNLAAFDGFLLKPFKIGELRSMIPASGTSVSGPSMPARETLDMSSFVPGAASENPSHCGKQEDSEPGGPPVLDEEIFGRMREMMPAEQLGQMYALCAGDARRRIARMGELAEAGDDAQYRAEAHSVKGGSGMIGARELHELAAVAERDGLDMQGRLAGTSGVTAALTQMSLACDRLERILGERTRE